MWELGVTRSKGRIAYRFGGHGGARLVAAWLLGCLTAWLLGCLAAWLLVCLASRWLPARCRRNQRESLGIDQSAVQNASAAFGHKRQGTGCILSDAVVGGMIPWSSGRGARKEEKLREVSKAFSLVSLVSLVSFVSFVSLVSLVSLVSFSRTCRTDMCERMMEMVLRMT